MNLGLAALIVGIVVVVLAALHVIGWVIALAIAVVCILAYLLLAGGIRLP